MAWGAGDQRLVQQLTTVLFDGLARYIGRTQLLSITGNWISGEKHLPLYCGHHGKPQAEALSNAKTCLVTHGSFAGLMILSTPRPQYHPFCVLVSTLSAVSNSRHLYGRWLGAIFTAKNRSLGSTIANISITSLSNSRRLEVFPSLFPYLHAVYLNNSSCLNTDRDPIQSIRIFNMAVIRAEYNLLPVDGSIALTQAGQRRKPVKHSRHFDIRMSRQARSSVSMWETWSLI